MKLKQIGSNMTELYLDNCIVVLFSYQTPVAARSDSASGFQEFDSDAIVTKTKYSRTTNKHITKWFSGRTQTQVLVDQSVLDALVGESYDTP